MHPRAQFLLFPSISIHSHPHQFLPLFLFHPSCLFLLSNTLASVSALLAPLLPANSSAMHQSLVPLPLAKTLPYFLSHLLSLHFPAPTPPSLLSPLPQASPGVPAPNPPALHALMPAFLQAAMAWARRRQRENQSWHCTVLEWEEIQTKSKQLRPQSPTCIQHQNHLKGQSLLSEAWQNL